MAARYKCNLCKRYDDALQHGMPGTSKRGISDHLSAVHGIAAPGPAYWTEFQAKWPAKVRKVRGDGTREEIGHGPDDDFGECFDCGDSYLYDDAADDPDLCDACYERRYGHAR